MLDWERKVWAHKRLQSAIIIDKIQECDSYRIEKIIPCHERSPYSSEFMSKAKETKDVEQKKFPSRHYSILYGNGLAVIYSIGPEDFGLVDDHNETFSVSSQEMDMHERNHRQSYYLRKRAGV